jgi:hypothetical protein
MPNKVVAGGMLIELAKEEKSTAVAGERLAQAQADFEIASRKYAAVRDATEDYLGRSPYASGVEWELDKDPDLLVFFLDRPLGRFRYIHMPIGNAIVAVLHENGGEMTLGEIAAALIQGGIAYPDQTLSGRSINAALMRTTRIERTGENERGPTYRFREVEVDPDDLPFE